MKTFKLQTFDGCHPDKEIVEFINTNNIKKEDSENITQVGSSYSLFYYGE